MKLRLLCAGLALVLAPVSLLGQGTQAQVFFHTYSPNDYAARVTYLDGTGVSTGFTAQLWGGPPGTAVDQLQPLFPTAKFVTLVPAYYGYVYPGGVVDIPNVTNAATLVMRAFNGPTWEQSACRGESAPITVLISYPPGTVTDLRGLQSFTVDCLPLPPLPQPLVNLVQPGSFGDSTGTNPLAINGGTVYQDIQTIPGQRYRVQFALYPDPPPGLNAYWAGQSLPIGAAGQGGWGYHSYFVAADTTLTRLSFMNEPTANASYINDVSLEPLPESPVPSCLNQWQSQDLGPPALAVKKLFHARGQYIALAQAPGTNLVVTSSDGTHWEQRFAQPALPGQNVPAIAFGTDFRARDLFVTVGNNLNWTSTDGTTWIPQASFPQADIRGLAYGQRLYVGVGAASDAPTNAAAFTSNSGWVWDPTTLPSGTPPLNAICYGNGQFIAVGSGGAIVGSADGKSWAPRTSSVSEDLRDVALGPGLFFAAGSNDLVTSPDGTNWTTRPVPGLANLQQVTYGRGLFLVTGYNAQTQPAVASSLDGAAWEVQTAWPGLGTLAAGDMLVGASNQQVFATGPLVFPPILWPNSLRRRGDGKVWIMVDSDPGQSVTLEASQNLRDWTALSTTTNQVSTFDMSDPNATTSSWRFYRVRR